MAGDQAQLSKLRVIFDSDGSGWANCNRKLTYDQKSVFEVLRSIDGHATAAAGSRGQHDHRCEKTRNSVGRRARNQRATGRPQHHRFLASRAIRVGADHDAPERLHYEAHAEYTDRQKELVHRRRRRQEQLADLDREETLDREIVVLERRTPCVAMV
jgi:hypothetical protein